jgi:ubiquinone/menaquinone biosynthesis C-methylase UbiE
MGQLRALGHLSALEQTRLERLFSMLPKDAVSVLEIGALHGVITERLAEIYPSVTALDLNRPSFEIPGVTTVAGDVQRLQFPDDNFDCVVCTEVLEHVPDYAAGACEIVRVAKSHILIGVPFRQDTRAGRTTCVHCGKRNPPFGHINSFTKEKLRAIFAGAHVASIEFVAENSERTNFVSAWLQDFALNPYGTYHQEEGCLDCSRKLEPPAERSFIRRAAGALGLALYKMQQRFNRPQPTWILMLLQKKNS